MAFRILLNIVLWASFMLIKDVKSATFDRGDYSVCTSISQENQGYSSIEVSGVTYWSHCGFPNPCFNQALCGRSVLPEADYRLCDPDDVLSNSLSNHVEVYLNTLEEKTPYQCDTDNQEVMNFTLLIAAVRHIQTPDLSVFTDVCINNCYEIKPTLTPATRNATDEEKQVGLEAFAAGLVDEWGSSFCDNTVVVAYWSTEQMLATAPGPRAKTYLSDSRISSVQTEALRLIKEGESLEGFKYLIQSYQSSLIGFSPAMILLCIFGVFLLLVGILLFAAFGWGKTGMGEYWDEGHVKVIIKTVLKIACGIWLIEGLIMGLIRLEEKARIWWTIVPLAGFVGCLAAALTLEFTGSTVSTNSSFTS